MLQQKLRNRQPTALQGVGLVLLIALAVSMAVGAIYNAISDSKYTETKYSDFLAEEEAGNLADTWKKISRP